jgi:hypothetical protein
MYFAAGRFGGVSNSPIAMPSMVSLKRPGALTAALVTPRGAERVAAVDPPLPFSDAHPVAGGGPGPPPLRQLRGLLAPRSSSGTGSAPATIRFGSPRRMDRHRPRAWPVKLLEI